VNAAISPMTADRSPDRPISDPTRERIERRPVLCGLITKTSSAYGCRRPCVTSDASVPGMCPAASDVVFDLLIA
jgi:hypothetical protein